MLAVATRARTMLALGLLTATSAVLWTLPLWDRISARGDDTDLAGATTMTAITVMSWLALSLRQRDREAYDRDRDAYTRALAARLSPHDGDGDPVSRRPERPAWVLYQKEPA